MISDYVKKFGPILISSWSNITYLTSYPGFSPTERECFLLLTKTKNYLITDGRYKDVVKKETRGFKIIDTGAVNFIQDDKQKILNKLETLFIEEDNLTVEEFKSLKKHVKKLRNIDLSKLRMIKSTSQIKNIKKACLIADKAFKQILPEIKVGVTEEKIANKMEELIKNQGAQISFTPIVAFGKNSAFPHHLSGKTKLKNNQAVLLDFGAKYKNYCSDMSRTVFYGKANARFKTIHNAVLNSQQKAINHLKSKISKNQKVTTEEIDSIARKYLINHGHPPIPHSVGHGIGIEVHEAPYISPRWSHKIMSGMVFSIEPGIYDPKFGGVRIEDLVFIGPHGLELISHSRRGIIELGNV